MFEKTVLKQELFQTIPSFQGDIALQYNKSMESFHRKIVVLDDDPTGIQTVHDVFVYTDWEKESLLYAFKEETPMIFVLTNSRGLTQSQTQQVHQKIAENILYASKKTGKKFVIISRSDSTLRGHYPLETQVLRENIENNSRIQFDGEVFIPFFEEGGRYTIHDIHYVSYGDNLVPAAETEFSKDQTFGFRSSDLKEYILEKHEGNEPEPQIISISLRELRSLDIQGILHKLCQIKNFGKIIVNAVTYEDVKVFVTALILAMNQGKEFLFRSAAAFPKILGNISNQPLLKRKQLIEEYNPNGGLIVVGSHVNKTTKQLNALKELKQIVFIEMNQHLVIEEELFLKEQERVHFEVHRTLSEGKTAVVYTRRERFDLNTGNKEDELKMAVKISNAVTDVVTSLTVKPRFIIAKGGITSSEIGVKALQVKKAFVLGQILPGIPVWKIGEESKFPNTSYVIFPGNVGDDDALVKAVEKMQ